MSYTPIQVRIRKLLSSLLPKSLYELIFRTWRKTLSRFVGGGDKEIIQKYTEIFLNEFGPKIVGGPFAGMDYVLQAAGSSYLLKLIGCYEEVLHAEIEAFKKRNYSTIIDIGCAEGYYLVGLGKYLPHTRLVGYDIDQEALKLTKELYTLNKLTNSIELIDNCTPSSLNAKIDTSTLLICDAEGFEQAILNPEATTELKNVQTYLIELHDFAAPGIKETLTRRFSTTHQIRTIRFKNASKERYPFLAKIENAKEAYMLLRERGEQDQEWLIMEKI